MFYSLDSRHSVDWLFEEGDLDEGAAPDPGDRPPPRKPTGPKGLGGGGRTTTPEPVDPPVVEEASEPPKMGSAEDVAALQRMFGLADDDAGDED